VHSALNSSPHPQRAEAPLEVASGTLAVQPPPVPKASGVSAPPESTSISRVEARPSDRPGSSKRAASAAGASASPPRASDDLDLLSRARQALASQNAQVALFLLDEDSREFPRSPYAEERSYTRVRALCELGRTAEAQTEADSFLKTWPSSMYTAGIHRSCGWRHAETAAGRTIP
jgi:hypothetical protein